MSDRLGIVDRVLSFIDRPWKAIVILVFVVVLGVGYAFWEKRAEFADAILRYEVHPQLLPTRFKVLGLKLMKATDADAVMLVSGNLNTNTARDIDGYDREERPWVALTGLRPVIYPETSVEIIIRLLANEVVCYDVTDGGGEVRAEERAGFKRACVVVIPPLPNQLVGALWLGWKKVLEPDHENHVQYLMHQTATELATW